ncbi:MAG: hypothetical protein ABSH37_19960, partial [Bryobacteraceae bacterium]
SAVGFLAIQHAGNFQAVALIAEEDPMVLSAKADQGWLDVPKLLGVPLAGQCVPSQRSQDLQSDRLLDAANVGFGLFRPDDPFSHCDQTPPNELNGKGFVRSRRRA